ncbi:hypothetical protein ACGFNU_21640 [Spirillospora sp. NPDC048911]|uniref:hypothetical protein n=1 Tax=Spirillospora sp. NPDC048911 TaxID=3364527 RepID=UPI00371826DC
MGAHSAPKRRRVWLSELGDKLLWPIFSAVEAAAFWLRERFPADADVQDDDFFAELTAGSTASSALALPVVPETVDDIAPAAAAAELAPSTLSAVQAVALMHHEHTRLPQDRLEWQFFDDGARGTVHVLDGPELEHRAIVGAYAQALGSQVAENIRQPEETGYAVVMTVGEYAGVRIGVEATICPDVSVSMQIFTEASQDPSLDEPTTQTFPAIILAEADAPEPAGEAAA